MDSPSFTSTCSCLLEKAMAPHSSTLAWKISWTEEPGGLQSMGSHRVGHDWSNLAAAATLVYTNSTKELSQNRSHMGIWKNVLHELQLAWELRGPSLTGLVAFCHLLFQSNPCVVQEILWKWMSHLSRKNALFLDSYKTSDIRSEVFPHWLILWCQLGGCQYESVLTICLELTSDPWAKCSVPPTTSTSEVSCKPQGVTHIPD